MNDYNDLLKLAKLSFFLSLLCVFPLTLPFLEIGPLNEILLSAIPMPVALLSTFVPIGIYCGYLIKLREERFDSNLKIAAKEKERLKLSFIARYHKLKKGGTTWEITSTDRFAWTNAYLFFEAKGGPEVKSEKVYVGNVAPYSRFIIQSELNENPGASWRVMLACEQGHVIKLAEVWNDPYFKAG